MCKACAETPDNQGRRCNRPEGQFTANEGDQRTVRRGLWSALAGLRNGDPQDASNALVHAVAAQQRIDGEGEVPTGEMAPTVTPHRDFAVSPSQIQVAEGRLELASLMRTRAGLEPLVITKSRSVVPVDEDGVLVEELIHLRAEGATQEELNSLKVTDGAHAPERKANTMAVLEASCAAVRLNGGVYVPRNQPNSTPSQIERYLAAEPGSPERLRLRPTAQDKEQAMAVRVWVGSQVGTNSYIQNLRQAVSRDHMALSDAGIASSAVKGFQDARKRYAELGARTAAQGNGGAASPMDGGSTPGMAVSRSRFLNQPGDKIRVTGVVEKAVRVFNERSPRPNYLYLVRTPEGDLVRWMATNEQGLEENDHVTLMGKVKQHSMFQGERQTEMFYCSAAIHSTV